MIEGESSTNNVVLETMTEAIAYLAVIATTFDVIAALYLLASTYRLRKSSTFFLQFAPHLLRAAVIAIASCLLKLITMVVITVESGEESEDSSGFVATGINVVAWIIYTLQVVANAFVIRACR